MNLEEFVRREETLFEAKVVHDKEAAEKIKPGKPAEKNGSDGKFEINPPVDNTAAKVRIPKDQLNRNMKWLLMKFRTRKDFMIIGKRGWAKTAIVEELSDKFGYEVNTVYIDKIDAEELGGRRAVDKDPDGHVKQIQLFPVWAEKMYQNRDKQYLLFFDEMNQGAPDVMNALMPIIKEHRVCDFDFKNFFVGAAGNFKSENNILTEIKDNKALLDRLRPIIIWESNTPDTWHNAFVHLHGKYDDKLGKEFVDLFEKDNPDLFDNPRTIDKNIFDFCWKLKKSGEYEEFDVDDYYMWLDGIANEDRTPSEEDQLKNTAEKIYNFINGNGDDEDEEEDDRGGAGNIDMVAQVTLDAIKDAMQYGMLTQEDENGKIHRYGLSKENLIKFIDDEEVIGEMYERIINKFEADGIKWKYETDEEWKKAGLEDPMDAPD